MSGSTGIRGSQIRPTAGRPLVRTGPLVAIGMVLAVAVLVGVLAFLQGA
jgi:hypothetical protein